jgi:hypothetical protein
MQFDHLKRRDFIALLGCAAAAWPLAARAQQPIRQSGRMPRVGLLMPGPAAHSAAILDPFYRGLHAKSHARPFIAAEHPSHLRCS